MLKGENQSGNQSTFYLYGKFIKAEKNPCYGLQIIQVFKYDKVLKNAFKHNMMISYDFEKYYNMTNHTKLHYQINYKLNLNTKTIKK